LSGDLNKRDYAVFDENFFNEAEGNDISGKTRVGNFFEDFSNGFWCHIYKWIGWVKWVVLDKFITGGVL